MRNRVWEREVRLRPQVGSVMLEEHTLEEASERFDHFKPIFTGGAGKKLKSELDIWLKEYGWRDDIEVA